MRFSARRGVACAALCAAVFCASTGFGALPAVYAEDGDGAIFGSGAPPAQAPPEIGAPSTQAGEGYSAPPEIGAPSAILVDAGTGEAIFEKGADAPRDPASLVKVMTALLAVEALEPDSVLTMDAEVYAVRGRQIFLQDGERITVESLLYSMMLYSADDSAVALAKAVSGSVDGFVELMNERARRIGCEGTVFVDPGGVSAEGQGTTARDLALIAREAMKDVRFRQYASAAEYTMPATNCYIENRIANSNLLLTGAAVDEGDAPSPQPGTAAADGAPPPGGLYVSVCGERRPVRYDGATGIKTGRTETSGACLAVSAARGDEEYIAVVLAGGPEMADGYADAITLLEYGFGRAAGAPEEAQEEAGEAMPPVPEGNAGLFGGTGLGSGDGLPSYLKIGGAAIILLAAVLLVVLLRHRYTRDPYVRGARYGRVTREISRVRRLR